MPRPVRVVMLTTFRERCGIATYSESLVAALGLRDVDVIVLAPFSRDAPRTSQPMRLWSRNRATAKQALECYRVIRNHHPDIVHFQVNLGLFSSTFVLVLAAALRRANIPVVATIHGRRGGIGRNFKWWRLGIGLRHATLVVHNDAHRAEFDRESVHVIPHGIDTFQPRERDKCRSAIGLHSSKFVIAHFGFLVEDKGIEDVIRAVARVRPHFPNLRYWVCGSAQSKRYVARLRTIARDAGVEDSIHIEDRFVPDEQMLIELQAADWVLLNYRTGSNQGASGAVRKAIATGTPVAVSIAPVFDDVREAVYTLDRPIDTGLTRMLSDAALAADVTHRARAFCKKDGWEIVAEKHVSLYESLLRARTQR